MPNVYSVGQLNSYIKNMFQEDFLLQNLRVKGEVSNCKYHSSGHIYFTLKDQAGAVSCVMFAGNRSGLSFRLADGLQVIVQGSADVYERDGKYQIYAKRIEPDGEGALFEQFNRLKQELMERGMFAPEYKKPIPQYIHTLGVVTAQTGAAVRDIIQISQRRNPYIQIILYPAIVQGEAAADSIVRGIQMLEAKKVDVMIVGRGGGSLEDLFAFNEEKVVQAVFDCEVPVISAVGHETDTTLIDFVSDLRAPTPSAAAEMAVFDFARIEQEQQKRKDRLTRQMQIRLERMESLLNQYRIRLQKENPEYRIREQRVRTLTLEDHLQTAIRGKLLDRHHQLELYIERMKGLSPLDKLKQGYSYVENSQGKTIRNIHDVAAGDLVRITVQNGMIDAKVTTAREENFDMEVNHE